MPDIPLSLIHLQAAVDEVTAAATAAENDFGTQLRAMQVRLDTLKKAYDLLITPSGEPMPTGNLPGWRLTWSEDFNIDCPEGGFVAAYPKIDTYPTTYKDTSQRGVYDPGIVSVSGSIARKRIHTDAAGIHRVAALVPRLGSQLGGKWGDVSGGRFAVRFRADHLPTYKMAWLLWPQSNHSLPDGEIDFAECGLINETISGYMHKQGAIKAGDQVAVHTNASPFVWNTCVIEWRMGSSLAFFINGVQQGLTLTAQVPATPMHWVLQTETTLDKGVAIDSSAAGNVEIDWIAYWSPAI